MHTLSHGDTHSTPGLLPLGRTCTDRCTCCHTETHTQHTRFGTCGTDPHRQVYMLSHGDTHTAHQVWYLWDGLAQTGVHGVTRRHTQHTRLGTCGTDSLKQVYMLSHGDTYSTPGLVPVGRTRSNRCTCCHTETHTAHQAWYLWDGLAQTGVHAVTRRHTQHTRLATFVMDPHRQVHMLSHGDTHSTPGLVPVGRTRTDRCTRCNTETHSTPGLLPL